MADNATPPQLTFTVGGFQANAVAVLLKTFAGSYVWRLDWWVAQTNSEQIVTYAVNNGTAYQYLVPELNKPLRICYGSCFGVHTLQDVNKLRNKNAMWKVLARVHQEKPYHLFFLGGDQVYSDQVWEMVPALRNWLSKKLKKRVQAPFTPEMEQEVASFYFNLYTRMWSQKQPAAILSQIPTLMMWDDHDIFDGWGSYVPEQQECPVFKGIYYQAREHFRLFQLQTNTDGVIGELALLGKSGYTFAHRMGDLALVALDLRSERTQNQVTSPESWDSLQTWLDEAIREKLLPDGTPQKACKHLLVLSGIPVVNADLTLLETALNIRPGQQRMEDDLKDQWLSRAHQQERLRLIRGLLKFSQESGCRVTLVSGDAHVAFTGFIQSEPEANTGAEPLVINQLTSSAMVNLPPPTLVVYMMEKLLAGKVEVLDQGITARLLKFPGTNRRIIGARNWLSLTLDEQPSIHAEWYVEGEEKPFAKVIPPINVK
ncbi:metallophosphatase [Adhaeribacter aerolatus]|uniref:Metallophosphatase n=1 Tax=Adhaeribacter aerolatus TaxID=670289 RepID=A0A512AWH1_9BACT|nr:metallophosphatase [Adhaeribacter aerolatus]